MIVSFQSRSIATETTEDIARRNVVSRSIPRGSPVSDWVKSHAECESANCEGAEVTRTEWQRIAEERVLDAEALLNAQRWSAAYYLAGYAVECGLKACVVVYVESNADVIFREKEYSKQCWTHDIEKLVSLAGLKAQRDADIGANTVLDDNWLIVKQWSEIARYESRTQLEAENLYQAVTDTANGVLPWIRNHW